MPAGIPVDRRPVPDIAVPVQRLRIARIGDDGVGLRESAQLRVVISRAVVVQPDCSIFPLACKAPGGDGCAAGVARLAPWLVPPGGCALEQLVQLDAAVVGGDVRAAQVVGEQVVGLSAGAHRDAPSAGVVIPPGGCALLGDRVAGLLVVAANVDGGRPVEGGFDPAAIGVVEEAGCGWPADGCQPVLGVVGQRVAAARCHVAVAVVAVVCAAGCLDGVRLGGGRASPAAGRQVGGVGATTPLFSSAILIESRSTPLVLQQLRISLS